MSALRIVALLLLAATGAPACDAPTTGSPLEGLCAEAVAACPRAPYVGILSAFPYEQRALRAAATIASRVVIDGRPFFVGTLAGHRVVMALAGIGLVNARASTTTMLDRFDVSAIVFSGVAGGYGHPVGDVLVPDTWTYASAGGAFVADRRFIARARAVARKPPALTPCASVPTDPLAPQDCPSKPTVTVGGLGSSSDPYGGTAFACLTPPLPPADVFGCDLGTVTSPRPTPSSAGAPGAAVSSAAVTPAPVSIDQESAAVAEVASTRGVPFVVVRGVSDEASFKQFFDYYRLGADNAAAVAQAILRRLPGGGRARTHAGTTVEQTAACDFARGTGSDCAHVALPRRVTTLVAAGCAQQSIPSQAASQWQQAAQLLAHAHGHACCAAALASRLQAAASLLATPH